MMHYIPLGYHFLTFKPKPDVDGTTPARVMAAVPGSMAAVPKAMAGVLGPIAALTDAMTAVPGGGKRLVEGKVNVLAEGRAPCPWGVWSPSSR